MGVSLVLLFPSVKEYCLVHKIFKTLLANSLTRHSLNVFDCAIRMEDVLSIFYYMLQADIAVSS